MLAAQVTVLFCVIMLVALVFLAARPASAPRRMGPHSPGEVEDAVRPSGWQWSMRAWGPEIPFVWVAREVCGQLLHSLQVVACKKYHFRHVTSQLLL